MEKDKKTEAIASIKFFRKCETDAFKELDEIYFRKFEKKTNARKSFQEILGVLVSPAFLKPFSCIGILRSMYVLTGIWVVTNYLQEILQDSEIPLDPSLCTLILVRLVFVI